MRPERKTAFTNDTLLVNVTGLLTIVPVAGFELVTTTGIDAPPRTESKVKYEPSLLRIPSRIV